MSDDKPPSPWDLKEAIAVLSRDLEHARDHTNSRIEELKSTDKEQGACILVLQQTQTNIRENQVELRHEIEKVQLCVETQFQQVHDDIERLTDSFRTQVDSLIQALPKAPKTFKEQVRQPQLIVSSSLVCLVIATLVSVLTGRPVPEMEVPDTSTSKATAIFKGVANSNEQLSR